MYRYQVTFEEGKVVIRGNLAEGSIIRIIPSADMSKKEYISLFLHQADLEQARDYLRCISQDNQLYVNEALFIAGLNNTVKCFKKSSARSKLDRDSVFRDEVTLEHFKRFEIMRDKHFVHDENAMLNTIDFIQINPDNNSTKKLTSCPSVVWTRMPLDYYPEGLLLQQLINLTLSYIEGKIDNLGDQIAQHCESLSRDELLALDEPKAMFATLESIEKNRLT
jgi:hypothetical protein